MSDGMLLGIDEGTTGVKAALFDQRLQPVAEARRDKVNRHPEEGWVEQDGEEVIAAVTEAVAELLEGADGEIAACGLDHQGESVLAWDSETGKPLSPIVVWQDKRSQEILDELTDSEDEVQKLSGLPFDPYFSAAKMAWLLRHNDDVKKARDDGRLRMGTVDSFLCDRLGAGFATEPATASRTQLQRIDRPGLRRAALRDLRHPDGRPARGARHGGRAGDAEARELAGRAAVPRPGRRPAGGAGRRGLRRARPGQGDLRHRSLRPRPRRRAGPEPAGGLLPTVAWSIDGKLEYALDGGVFAAGAMLEWMCNQLGIAEDPPALSKLAREAETSAGARVLPGLAGIGAPWWRPNARAVISGIYGGTTRENVARAALEGIAWRVADVVAAIKETAPVDTLRVDGGLTNEPLLLQMQADMIGAPVEAAGADATVLGAAALGGVGAGVIDSLTDLPEMLPADRQVEPERDEEWRSTEHERWREFVRATEALDPR